MASANGNIYLVESCLQVNYFYRYVLGLDIEYIKIKQYPLRSLLFYVLQLT